MKKLNIQLFKSKSYIDPISLERSEYSFYQEIKDYFKETFDKLFKNANMENQDIIKGTVKLTGNYYFKPTLFGLILMVEKIYNEDTADQHIGFYKANVEDIFQLGLMHVPTVK